MRMHMRIMHMHMHMHMHIMHSVMILFQELELETHRHLQLIKGRKRKERDMSTSRKRVYRREGKILIRIGLVQGKNMVGEGSQRGGMDMDIIPVPTNVMKLIVEIAEKEMNTTVTVIRETEKEIEIPLGQLIVMTEARKIPMVGKGEEVEV